MEILLSGNGLSLNEILLSGNGLSLNEILLSGNGLSLNGNTAKWKRAIIKWKYC